MAVPENDNGFGDNGFVNRQMLINHYFAVQFCVTRYIGLAYSQPKNDSNLGDNG